MKLLADLHTHSKFSRWFHGKNTIEEIVIEANEKGLQEVAITDHGYKHLFRTSKENIIKAREIVDELNSWSTTKVLLGIEADILDEAGNLDIDNETLDYLDILIVGYHPMIKTDFASFFGAQENSEEAKQKATNAFLNAMEKYPVTILSHLNARLNLDLYQIGCACRDKGVMVELNSRHANWTEKQIKDLLESECMFVVNSDAHDRVHIGETNEQFEMLKKYKIPNVYVANVEYSPEEKTAEDTDIDVYYGIYKRKRDEEEAKLKSKEEKEKTEFTNTLSDEMEEALQKIAEEKGLDYKNPNSKIDYDKLKSQVDAEYEFEMSARERDNQKIKNQTNESFESEVDYDDLDDFSENFGDTANDFVENKISEDDFKEMRNQIDSSNQDENNETLTQSSEEILENTSLENENISLEVEEQSSVATAQKEPIELREKSKSDEPDQESEIQDNSENILKQFEKLGKERKSFIESGDDNNQDLKMAAEKRYEKDVNFIANPQKKQKLANGSQNHIRVVNENIDEREENQKKTVQKTAQNKSAELSQKRQRSKFKPLAILDVDGANGDKSSNGDGVKDDGTQNEDKK